MKTKLHSAALAIATLTVAALTSASGAIAQSHGSYGRNDGYSAPVQHPEPRWHNTGDSSYGSNPRREYRSNDGYRTNDGYRPVWKPRRDGY